MVQSGAKRCFVLQSLHGSHVLVTRRMPLGFSNLKSNTSDKYLRESHVFSLVTTRLRVLDRSRATKMDVTPKPGVPCRGMTDTWLKKHTLIYTGATRHPFILAIRDGTVDISAFKRWLSQDYIFVRAFVPFVASLVVKAWKKSDDSHGDVEVILSGLAALNDEIDWFKKQASKWGVDLSVVAPQKPTQDYCRFLENLTSPEVDYTVGMTAYWAIEAVYQESFAHCLGEGSKTPPELEEVCQRWGNDGFGNYCSALRSIADRRLLKATDDEVSKAEVTFLRVLEYEVQFWNMSRGIPGY